ESTGSSRLDRRTFPRQFFSPEGVWEVLWRSPSSLDISLPLPAGVRLPRSPTFFAYPPGFSVRAKSKVANTGGAGWQPSPTRCNDSFSLLPFRQRGLEEGELLLQVGFASDLIQQSVHPLTLRSRQHRADAG